MEITDGDMIQDSGYLQGSRDCLEGGTRGLSGVTWVIVTWMFTFLKDHKTVHSRSVPLTELNYTSIKK